MEQLNYDNLPLVKCVSCNFTRKFMIDSVCGFCLCNHQMILSPENKAKLEWFKQRELIAREGC